MAAHDKNLREQIEVMEAFGLGEAIEIYSKGSGKWLSQTSSSWNWEIYNYRIRPVPKITRQQLVEDIRQAGVLCDSEDNESLAAFHRLICASTIHFDGENFTEK